MVTQHADGLSMKEKNEILHSDHIEHNQTVDHDWSAKEKKLVRKLDMTLMPMVWILYLFNYLDRNNIAYVETVSFHKPSS